MWRKAKSARLSKVLEQTQRVTVDNFNYKIWRNCSSERLLLWLSMEIKSALDTVIIPR